MWGFRFREPRTVGLRGPTYVCVHIYTCMYIYICVCVFIHVLTYICIHKYVHICPHIYIYITQELNGAACRNPVVGLSCLLQLLAFAPGPCCRSSFPQAGWRKQKNLARDYKTKVEEENSRLLLMSPNEPRPRGCRLLIRST